MTTRRQLSDAVKADYDRLVALDTAGNAALERWTLTRAISGWLIVGVAATMTLLVLGSMLGSVVAGVLFVMLLLGGPFMVIPAVVVFLIAAANVTARQRGTRARMFTLYGIEVDESITPAVYRVSVPATWLHPQLHDTRRALRDERTDAPAPAPAVPAREHLAATEPATTE
jgi:hypothetical protein